MIDPTLWADPTWEAFGMLDCCIHPLAATVGTQPKSPRRLT